MDARSRLKDVRLFWLKLVVSGLLLGVVVFAVDPDEALVAVRAADATDLLKGLLLILLAYLSNGLRLYWLSRAAGARVPPTSFAVSYAVGLFFNGLLPTGVGGDAIRVVLLGRQGYPWGALVLSSLVDRWFGLVAVLAIGGAALLLAPEQTPLRVQSSGIIGAILLLGAVMGGLALPFAEWALPRLALHVLPVSLVGGMEAARTSLRALLSRRALLPGGMALSVLSHVFIILAYVSCGASLVTGVSATQYFVAIPVVMLLHALPISLGGLGVRELGTVGVLVWMGAGQQTAMTLSLVLLALYWVSVLPGLLLALAMGLSWRDIKGSGRVSR